MLRVYTHIHSTFSYDGKWPLERVASAFRSLGADLLLCSEHSQRIGSEGYAAYRRQCEALSTENFRIIGGIEYSTPKNYIHFPTWGLDEYLGEEVLAEDLLSAVREAQAWCIMAHPDRRDAWQDFNSDWPALGLAGIEIWNRKTDGLVPSENALRLARENGLDPVASVDFHDKKQLYPLYNALDASKSALGDSDAEILRRIRETPMAPMVSGFGVLADSAGSKLVLSAHRQLETLRRFKNSFKKKSKRRT